MKIRTTDWWLLRKANTAGGERMRSAEASFSRAGDGAMVWLGAAGVLAATGHRGRKAALHGLAGLALAPVVVNATKVVVGRPRPAGRWVGLRRSGRSPRTSSFPSGHTASAVAFTVAAGGEAPVGLLVLAPLAIAVAGSRPASGRHFPGDVLGGVVVGTVAGLASGAMIRRIEERRTPADSD